MRQKMRLAASGIAWRGFRVSAAAMVMVSMPL
jgi:hypothetical protein